ncbi:hypothetical protein BJ138DRAFT_1117272 [Hygrophoropsis aurantiaca]|uniref:Uncharacterized protein n=1 Tax=Hygrophoropsis aurantiaca TaxID=72124 RepID=A0ACB8A151_9AGAM|nr:hypothetical protein BJ138DRAFT_1117272 [Hygrophoropsis aurantiaca]
MSSELISNFYGCLRYHTELPQILVNNGEAGEIEEGMMWFASGYEKLEDKDLDDKDNANGAGMGAGGTNDNWREDAEERWRRKWLERLARREVQIQILLYLLKPSLPGPQLPLPPIEVLIPPTSSTSALFPNASSLSRPTPSTVLEVHHPPATPTKPKVRQLKRSNTGVTTSRTLVGSPSPGPSLSLDINIGADNSDKDRSSSPYSLRLGMGTSPESGSRPGFYSGSRSSAADDFNVTGEVDTDIEENGDMSPENTIMDPDKDEEEADILFLGIPPPRPRSQTGAKARLFDPSPSPPASSPLARSAVRNEARSLKRVASASMDTGAERDVDFDAHTKTGSGLHAGKRTLFDSVQR